MSDAITKISRESLIEFGMGEPEGDAKMLFPLEKILSTEEFEDGGHLAIVVTRLRNGAELALLLPDGAVVYLGGIQTIEELKVFEKAITEWEPNF